MSLPSAIYRRLDFGINISDEPASSANQVSTKSSESPHSRGEKRAIEDVSPGDNSEPSVSVSPAVKAQRKSPRLAVKALKSVLSKRLI